MAVRALELNLLQKLKDIKSFKREVTVETSRFDVVGVDNNGDKFIMEIKCVPLSKPVDCKSIKLKEFGKTHAVNSNIEISTTAYFPEG